MADDVPTPEEFATWYSPRVALSKFAGIIGDEASAAKVIIERLHGGMLKAAAKSSSSELVGRVSKLSSIVLVLAEEWGGLSRAHSEVEFWKAGEARFTSMVNVTHQLVINTVRYFGVRLDRVGIDEWLADLPAVPIQDTPSEPDTLPPEEARQPAGIPRSKGPRVANEHLRLWFELYRQVFRGSEDTEPNAIKSAEGMFHAMSVSRDRIRELRGKQKAGRKRVDKPE
jgi:hypothetical protein